MSGNNKNNYNMSDIIYLSIFIFAGLLIFPGPIIAAILFGVEHALISPFIGISIMVILYLHDSL